MGHICNTEEGNHHLGSDIYVNVTFTVFLFEYICKTNVCNITKCEKNDGV